MYRYTLYIFCGSCTESNAYSQAYIDAALAVGTTLRADVSHIRLKSKSSRS